MSTPPPRVDYNAVHDELAHQQPEAISAMFGRVAQRYDLLNRVISGGLDLYYRRQLVHAVNAQKPRRVLDLATGSGDVILALKRNSAYAETAVGADFCLPMLQQARAKGAPNLTAGDAMRLPFPDASFDAITISFGLRNVADRRAGLAEMRRVLRPGGRAYVLEFSHPPSWLAPAYFWYMRHIMPFFAQFFTSERGAYEYLGDSIKAFLPQAALAGVMRQAGFASASWTNFTLGIVALHIAEV
ncbi:MAG: class I SAM-dependent methyltransferase [Methylacidiphilales bacterium]|nr:class I SAM-dependent methyltransferase [Candidatus Methylacidiphilales bacterium]